MTAAGSEPTVEAFGGTHPGQLVRRLFFATRPMFLTASVLPVLLGTAWGYGLQGRADIAVAVCALLATVLVHAGANVLNDVFDDLSGADRVNCARIFPFTGGSRFIQNGVISRANMTALGVVLLATSVPFALALIAARGAGVLAFGLTGVALGVLYSAPPVQLCHRGLGETVIAVAFGVVPVTGAAWLQSGVIEQGSLVLGAVTGLWAASILLVNEIPDLAGDAAVGKRTLPVRLGVDRTLALYVVLHWTACALVGAVVLVTDLPAYAAAVPLALAVAASLAARATAGASKSREALVRFIKTTLGIHAAGTLWLTLSAGMAALA